MGDGHDVETDLCCLLGGRTVLDVEGKAAAGGWTGTRKRGMQRRGSQHAALKGKLLDGEGGGWAGQHDARGCLVG